MSNPLPRSGGEPTVHVELLAPADLLATAELLAAIDEHGVRWPAALDHYSLETVTYAVRREMAAGNLRDGRTLTPQGSEALGRARGLGRAHTEDLR